jgi:antitoxin component of MazEF toxin-antitoxin module
LAAPLLRVVIYVAITAAWPGTSPPVVGNRHLHEFAGSVERVGGQVRPSIEDAREALLHDSFRPPGTDHAGEVQPDQQGRTGDPGLDNGVAGRRRGDTLSFLRSTVENAMIKRLTKHGNSLALVIDKALLELLDIAADTPLEIQTDGRSLIVTPARDPKRRRALRKSLERVNKRHGEALRKLAE